jgi:glucoamylase
LWTGAALAKAPGARGGASAWTTKTDTGLSFLQTGNPFGRFVASNIDQRSELDANPVFARIHAFDSVAGWNAAKFRPCSGTVARTIARPRRVY